MLTGDNERTARAVAQKLGIDEVEAGVEPQHKNERVRKLREQGHVVAMAGDGINDAPALAAADVGIAMGTGTDVAMESAGITLLKGDLRGIEKAIRLSRAMMRNIRQNLFFAFIYNAARHPHRRRRALSVLRPAAQPDDRGRRDEPQLRLGDRQRAALAASCAPARHQWTLKT